MPLKVAVKAEDVKKCACCKKGVAHTGLPLFWRIEIQRMGLDGNAIRQTHGLEQMMGGNVALARIMGPNPDIAKPISDPVEIWICEHCAGEPTTIYQLGMPE